MKKDIKTRADVERLVDSFYTKVKYDDLIGPVFTDVAKINWERHLPVMVDFWENALFYTGNYTGNPMDLHVHLHHVAPLMREHFQRWNDLFVETVSELFTGTKADLAIHRALSISAVLQEKILKNST